MLCFRASECYSLVSQCVCSGEKEGAMLLKRHETFSYHIEWLCYTDRNIRPTVLEESSLASLQLAIFKQLLRLFKNNTLSTWILTTKYKSDHENGWSTGNSVLLSIDPYRFLLLWIKFITKSFPEYLWLEIETEHRFEMFRWFLYPHRSCY